MANSKKPADWVEVPPAPAPGTPEFHSWMNQNRMDTSGGVSGLSSHREKPRNASTGHTPGAIDLNEHSADVARQAAAAPHADVAAMHAARKDIARDEEFGTPEVEAPKPKHYTDEELKSSAASIEARIRADRQARGIPMEGTHKRDVAAYNAKQSAPAAPAKTPGGRVTQGAPKTQTPKPVTNPSPVAPTPQSAPTAPGEVKYGPTEGSGQETFFGRTGLRGNKTNQRLATRGLAFGEAVESHTESGPGPGQGVLFPTAPSPSGPAPVTPSAAPKATKTVKKGPAPREASVEPMPAARPAPSRTPAPPQRTPLNPAQMAAPATPSTPAPSIGTSPGTPKTNTRGPSAPTAAPRAAGRTGEAPRREIGGGRASIHVEGTGNSNIGNVTHNTTYNYNVSGDNYGHVGNVEGGGGRGTPGGTRGRGGAPAGGHDGWDVWVNDATGHHSLREGAELIKGERVAGQRGGPKQPHHHLLRQQSGGQQQPIQSSPRGQGGATGTGTNFNWQGPVATPAPVVPSTTIKPIPATP